MAGRRSGERALFVAEKLGLNQLRGNRRAIQRDERMLVARRLFVNGARDQFFPRAGLAQDANARFAGRDPLDLRQQLFHGGTGADQFVFAEALAQLAVFVFQARQAQCIFDGDQQLVGRERLLQKVQRAKPRGFHGHFDIGLARD